MFVKSSINHDSNSVSLANARTCSDPSLAQQEFRDEVDINNLVNLYIKVGMPPPVPASFVEFAEDFDLRLALESVIEARQQFETLPAKVRHRFRHDPSEFMDFISDPDNRQEAVFMGLIEAPPASPPTPNPAPSEPPAHEPT